MSKFFVLENIETGEMLAPFTSGMRWPRTREIDKAIKFENAGDAARYKRSNAYNPADWREVQIGD